MAKMFYSAEEAAQKLGISEEAVQDMASSGQIQQFRDREKLMFKREQIDMLAAESTSDDEDLIFEESSGESGGGFGSAMDHLVEDDDSTIPLADPSSDTLMPIDPPTQDVNAASPPPPPPTSSDDQTIELKEPSLTADQRKKEVGSGVYDSLTESDTAHGGVSPDQTQITDSPPLDGDDGLLLENIGSGSGLLDLTREIDDTSLGAELLDEIYPIGQDSGAGLDASGSGSDLSHGSGSGTGMDHISGGSSGTGMDQMIGSSGTGMEHVSGSGTGLDHISGSGTGLDYTTQPGSDAPSDDFQPDTSFTSSSIYDGPVDVEISTTGLENLQDTGEPSSVVPSMTTPAQFVEVEAIDYPGNGISIGMLLGSLTALFLVLTVVMFAVMGVPSAATASMAKYPLVYPGVIFGVSIILSLAGFLFGTTQQKK